jgi:hypothetical protein
MTLGESGARLAQSAERKALNLVVVGSSPTVGDFSQVTFLNMPKQICCLHGVEPPLRTFAA